MKKTSKSSKLLRELSRDPRLKQAIAKTRRKTRDQSTTRVENVTGMFLAMLAIASRFSKKKKKARALDDLMDIIYLLLQISLMLKENIFDRPEVKKFFSQKSKQIYAFAQECVALVLPKPIELRPVQASRPVSGGFHAN